MRPRLYVQRRFEGDGFDRAAERFDLVVLDAPLREAVLAGRLADAAAIWTFGERIDAAFLDALPGLRAIGNQGAGFNTIDVDEVARRGVTFVVPRGVNADAVADHAIGLLIAVRHRIVEGDRFVRSGAWAGRHGTEPMGDDLTGTTLGILGFGAIGQEVARRAVAFRMRVLTTTRSARPLIEAALGVGRVSLAELLPAVDHLSINCPLTPQTTGLIGARELACMRRSAVLVNTARGAVVDEDALARALAEGTILGAGLDVFTNEPDVPAALLDHPRVVLTPHIADYQPGAIGALTAAVVDGLVAVFR